MRRSRVERIVSLVVEGDSFQGIFSLLDIGAGSDFIILEEDRTTGISLGVYSLIRCTSSFEEGFGSDVVGCLFRVEAGLHQQNYYNANSLISNKANPQIKLSIQQRGAISCFLLFKSREEATAEQGYIIYHYNNPMNAELLLRLTHMKQYITSLNDSLSLNDTAHASATVSRFKKSMNKSDEHVHASQFVLDCLKTRNQKLRNELMDMEEEKKTIEGKLLASKNSKKEIKPLKIEIYLTRLTLTLNESKKVEYEEAVISSDYKNIHVNSTVGKKYQNYAISIEEMQQLEQKGNHLYFCVMSEQVYHVIVRFKQEKEALKWSLCIKYAQIIIQNKKKKDKLFEETKQVVTPPTVAQNMTQTAPQPLSSPPQNNQAMQLRASTVKSTLGVPHIPFLNLNGQNKPISPTESIIQVRKYGEKSFDRDQADKSGEKNTERSLVNAMNFQGYRSSKTFYNFKDTNYQKRIELTRPPNLTKLRNSNTDSYSLLQNAKSKLPGYRKQSEDIKPQINQIFQEQMLAYRSKVQKQDDANSESNFRYSNPLIQKLHSNSPEKIDKFKHFEDKKKDLPRPPHMLYSEKPATDNKIGWMGIEEMEDQNKSKSSNRVSNKSRRASEFSEPGTINHQILKKQIQQTVSEQISEKSQEQSPRMPTRNTPAANLKVSYQNGMTLQLHPVSPSVQSPSKEAKSQNSSSVSNSGSEQQSEPSAHQNHTQSQQNNAKSQQLKKGIIVTKCSENGFWPHEKILYLSENQSQLCSRDLKDKKIKKIKLVNIKDVEYRKFDKGIIKHFPKFQEDKCMVIRALDDDSKIKNFEYVATSAQALARFAESLKWFVDYHKQQ